MQTKFPADLILWIIDVKANFKRKAFLRFFKCITVLTVPSHVTMSVFLLVSQLKRPWIHCDESLCVVNSFGSIQKKIREFYE